MGRIHNRSILEGIERNFQKM